MARFARVVVAEVAYHVTQWEEKVSGTFFFVPVESDRHFLTLVRYVERNAQRAALVKKAEDGPGSSLYARQYGNEKPKKMLSPWPMAEPQPYREWLNASQGQEEIENIR
jgi:putative transposase